MLRLQEGEAPRVLQALTAGDLLQVKPGAWLLGGLLQAAVLEDAAPLEGVHDLRPPGPWPAEGSLTATNGRLPGLWNCWVCGKGAADSSRAVALARKPCGAAAWQSEPACHDLQDHGSGLRCTRCLLQVSQQHAGQVSRSKCPVPVLTRGVSTGPKVRPVCLPYSAASAATVAGVSTVRAAAWWRQTLLMEKPVERNSRRQTLQRAMLAQRSSRSPQLQRWLGWRSPRGPGS